ncbi:hypothetical protein VaNZ11_013486 [Volvox africanus]|uniref:Centrosomal protein of 290kDa coiled-coil region domain-containing protein n=1 Tax=Volvox africanus TaxID=51714 RepID=A0ABQ5SGA1_9CHLO|nr:hypothetical protein VaNZ11_013486 [Volvox africanus]
MAEGDYEFRPKPAVLSRVELDELLRIAPPAEAIGRGFTLQEADVDRVISAARELEGAQVVADPNLPPQQTIETLLKVVRVLQTAIDVQFSENEELTADFNELQNNELRRLREENNRLREMRDQEEATADVGELRRRNEDLLDQLDELEQLAEQLRESEKEALARRDEVEESIKERDKELLKLQTRMADVEKRYERARDDYNDLKERYRTLSQEHDRVVSEARTQDTKQQSEWKIERLTKDNRALEVANTELRKDLQAVKEENLEVSEKIIELNTQHQELLSKNLVLETRIEEMASDKENLLSIQDELRTELQDKMTLLDEFEDKFNRQYRSWEDEKAGLVAQIEALRRESKSRRVVGKDGETVNAEPGSVSVVEVAELRQELNDVREDKILLLEAYEQLEEDVAKEVDRALSRQQEEMDRLKRRVDFLQRKLEEQDEDAEDAKDLMMALEEELKDAHERNKLYEQGLYGLPQAVEEIRQLRADLTKANKRMENLVQQINKQAAKVEDLYDENAMLRKQANLGDTDKVDIRDIKMQKEATIAQLRALNALLERQVADLEEERRKLRMEMKFRAKYHGQHALEMGLTNDKLLLLEEYADKLKNNRVEEARVVDQLQQRINFLEVRLAEVMAYADIPPSMRPALSEFDPTGLGTFQEAVQAAVAEVVQVQPSAMAALPTIKAKEVEAVRKVLSGCMRRLKQMSKSLLEQRNISDRDYQRFVDVILGELVDADKVLGALLKEPTALVTQPSAATGAEPGFVMPSPRSPAGSRPLTPLGSFAPTSGRTGVSVNPHGAAGPAVIQLLPGDAGYLADAVAEELRERLRGLAKQVADLQADVAQKDVRITQLVGQKADLERRIGLNMGDRKSEYVTIAEYEDVQLEVQALKDQLISVLEELSSREREAADLHDASLRYHSKMQMFSDQVKLLYREYAGAQAGWKIEKLTLEKKSQKAHADANAYKIATRELQMALDTLSKSRDLTQVEKEYLDTVRRMAVVQIKQAKLARELEASVSGEKALVARVTELEEEVRDVSSTARGRIRWLDSASEQSKRRLEQLYRELEISVPLTVYHSLVGKHTRLQHEYRKLLEEQAEAVVGAGQEEVFRLRDDLNEMLKRYDQAASQAAELRARLHQAEQFVKAAQEAATQHQSGDTKLKSGKQDAQSKPTSSTLAGSQKLAAPPIVLDNALGQELVAARVQEEAALRRVELVEKERDRVQHSLVDMQGYGKELEKRLAQSAAELELARQTASGLERRLVGAKTKDEVDEMVRRMHAAEAAAAEVQKSHSDLVYKAEEAERRAEAATRDRLRFLAEITNLKAALRDMSGRSDKAALIGKLHLELDHSRTKETLARNALNRSELQRIELEKTIRRQKQELANLTGRVVAHQDHAAWSDRQRHEAQAQLQVSLAGRTETWKARLWTRKLEQLKQRNESLADGLELARKRILKIEDARQEAELKLDFKEDLASWAHRSANDLTREVARLGDQLLQLRLEKGKLTREDMLLKEKVHYTERVNAELHDLLEKYEAEYFQAQSQLEADRAAAEMRAVGLQEEVEKLQERINSLLATKDLNDAATDGVNGAGGVTGLRGSRTAGHAFTELSDAAAGVTTFRKTLAERDEIIGLIEALKVAREEAEHLRTDRARLQGDYDATLVELEDVRRHHHDALDRLTQQSDALLYALNQFKSKGADATVFDQMKAVAEATINELKQRIKDRDSLIAELRKQLKDEGAQMLARHNADRAEIERLNEKLFERNDASIQDLKCVLDRLPLKQGAQQVPEEQLKLREALERAQDMITVLKNRLEQKDAAIDMLKLSYEQELQQLRDLLAAARSEAESRAAAAAKAARDEGPTKAHLQKLNTQLKTKDEMLRQLRAAIKALEAKLTQVMKEHADEKMQAASWHAQERMQEQLDRLTQERDELTRRLALAEDNVAAATGIDSEVQEQLAMLRRRIQEEIDKRVIIERQLVTVREELQKFKNAREAVVDLTTGMSIEAKRHIEDLQKRINVLEKQNAVLKRKAQEAPFGGPGEETNQAGAGVGEAGGDDFDGPGGGKRQPARGSSSRRGAPTRRDNDAGGGGGEDQTAAAVEHDPEAEERRERALLQWEEGKKLNGKIDSLRKQLAAKTNEVVTLQKELERRTVQAASVQSEADKQAAAIRDLTEKLRRAQDAPRTDRAKLQEYMERCTSLEETRDAMSVELTRLKLQLQAAAGSDSGGASTSVAPPASPGAAQLRRQEDVLELRLQRDQLQLQVKRLKERLAILGTAPDGATGSVTTRRAGSAGARLGVTGTGSSGITSGREAELLSTITNLKAALEKATANSTPTTKYMQEVNRRKDAARDAEAARAELERLKQQLTASSRMVAELQSANAELRRQLRASPGLAAAAAAGVGVAELGLQLSNLEMLLGQRDEEVAALRGALAQRDAELEALRGPDGTVGVASGTEVSSLRRQLRELEAENEDLRNELNAFDPSFWDEVMEMKQQHAELSRMVERYEELVIELSERLGIPPQLQRRGRATTGRTRGRSDAADDRPRPSPRRGSR